MLAALLLGSLASVSLALPMRLAVFWQALPGVLEAMLWFPFTTSAAAGATQLATALTQSFTTRLHGALSQLSALPDITITRFGANALLTQMIADPAEYVRPFGIAIRLIPT